jgi:hypothetical protein
MCSIARIGLWLYMMGKRFQKIFPYTSMEVFVNEAGKRVFINAPYVDQSELKRNVILYDPNGYNIGAGLYDRTQQTCARWVDHFHQFQKKHPTPPAYEVRPDGETIWVEDRITTLRPPQNFVSYR